MQNQNVTPVFVSVDAIDCGVNPYRALSPDTLQRLKNSIVRYGFVVPIHLSQKEDGRYNLEDGFHRLQAAKDLNFKTISAIIVPPEEGKLKIGDILNLVRRHLNDDEIIKWEQTLAKLDGTLKKADELDLIMSALQKLPKNEDIQEKIAAALKDHSLFEEITDSIRRECMLEVEKDNDDAVTKLCDDLTRAERRATEFEQKAKEVETLLKDKDEALAALRIDLEKKAKTATKIATAYEEKITKLEGEGATGEIKKVVETRFAEEKSELEKEIEKLRTDYAKLQGEKEKLQESKNKTARELLDAKAVSTILDDRLDQSKLTIQRLKGSPEVKILEHHWKIVNTEVQRISQLLRELDWPETLRPSLKNWTLKTKESLDQLVSDFDIIISARTATDLPEKTLSEAA